MKPCSSIKSHVFASLALVVGVYGLARALGWTGARAHVTFDNRLLVPGIVVVTLWGIGRLARRNSCD